MLKGKSKSKVLQKLYYAKAAACEEVASSHVPPV
jgi:hypothetical protein